jgi:hypothetical protein
MAHLKIGAQNSHTSLSINNDQKWHSLHSQPVIVARPKMNLKKQTNNIHSLLYIQYTSLLRQQCSSSNFCLPHKQFFCPFLLPEETFASFSTNLLSRGTDWKTKNRQAHFSNKACWKINTIPVKIFLFFFWMNHFSLNDVIRIK